MRAGADADADARDRIVLSFFAITWGLRRRNRIRVVSLLMFFKSLFIVIRSKYSFGTGRTASAASAAPAVERPWTRNWFNIYTSIFANNQNVVTTTETATAVAAAATQNTIHSLTAQQLWLGTQCERIRYMDSTLASRLRMKMKTSSDAQRICAVIVIAATTNARLRLLDIITSFSSNIRKLHFNNRTL